MYYIPLYISNLNGSLLEKLKSWTYSSTIEVFLYSRYKCPIFENVDLSTNEKYILHEH